MDSKANDPLGVLNGMTKRNFELFIHPPEEAPKVSFNIIRSSFDLEMDEVQRARIKTPQRQPRKYLHKVLWNKYNLDYTDRESIINLYNQLERGLAFTEYKRLPKQSFLLNKIFQLRGDHKRSEMYDISHISEATLEKYEAIWTIYEELNFKFSHWQ